MKRVLLNITAAEMIRISGDISYYRNLLETIIPSVQFVVVNPLSVPSMALRQMRRVAGRMLNGRWPRWFNEWLFPMARYSFLPARALEGVDAILSHITFPLFPPGAHRPPIVWSTQGISPPSYYDYYGTVTFEQVVGLSNYFGARADRVIAWTHSCAEIMRRHCNFSTAIEVLPPSLPPPHPSAKRLSREAETHLLFIGREPKRKGLYDVLEAFTKLNGARERVHLDVVSCVPESVRSSLRGHKNVRFHEGVSDEQLGQLLDRADVFILPTYAETYGFVLIEAMARGCALITADYAPLNELVEDGRNGLLVKPGDVSEIVRAMEILVGNPALTKAFAQAGSRKYCQTLSPEAVIPKYIRLFNSVWAT